MKHAKPAHRKPWKEEHQMVLSCSIFIALFFGGMFLINYIWPPSPRPASASSPTKAGALR